MPTRPGFKSTTSRLTPARWDGVRCQSTGHEHCIMRRSMAADAGRRRPRTIHPHRRRVDAQASLLVWPRYFAVGDSLASRVVSGSRHGYSRRRTRPGRPLRNRSPRVDVRLLRAIVVLRRCGRRADRLRAGIGATTDGIRGNGRSMRRSARNRATHLGTAMCRPRGSPRRAERSPDRRRGRPAPCTDQSQTLS